MSNTIEGNNQSKLFNRFVNGLLYVSVAGAGGAVILAGTQVPGIVRAERAYWEQTAKDREALERYAPQIKNGEPLTIEQGVELIQQEHDNNPKDGKISIAESFDILNRVKRYEGRTYVAWNESSKNLFQALMEIDKKQTK